MVNRFLDWWYDKVLEHALFLNYLSLRYSLRFIKENLKGELVGVEIGILQANDTKVILDKLPIKKLYLIDPYLNSGKDGSEWKFDSSQRKRIAQKRLKKYKSKIQWFYDFSYNVSDSIPNDLDFVYIDGDHRYESVKKDIELYYPKIKKGGVLAGHDYNYYDVSRAVIEFANKSNLNVTTKGYNVDWWINKT